MTLAWKRLIKLWSAAFAVGYARCNHSKSNYQYNANLWHYLCITETVSHVAQELQAYKHIRLSKHLQSRTCIRQDQTKLGTTNKEKYISKSRYPLSWGHQYQFKAKMHLSEICGPRKRPVFSKNKVSFRLEKVHLMQKGYQICAQVIKGIQKKTNCG